LSPNPNSRKLGQQKLSGQVVIPNQKAAGANDEILLTEQYFSDDLQRGTELSLEEQRTILVQ